MASLRTVLAAVVLCLVGPAFLALTLRNELRARALDERGVIALAYVVAITPDPDTDDGARLEYRLNVDGATYDGANRHLARAELEAARAIGRIEVRYLPDDPTVSAPTRAATRRTQIVAFVVSSAVTMAGLALAAVVISTKRKTGRWYG